MPSDVAARIARRWSEERAAFSQVRVWVETGARERIGWVWRKHMVGDVAGYVGQTRDRSIKRSGHANTSCGAINNACQDERVSGKRRGAIANSVGRV